MTAQTDSNASTLRLARLGAAALLSSALAAPLAAQTDKEPFACGAYRKLHSTVLGEERTLLVGLPADYEKSSRAYPVLYRLDGDSVSFLHTISATAFLVDMREQKSDYIVVAIQNTDRRRDMNPEGGADSFIRFIKTELVPYVEQSYRTNGSRILAGQSFSASGKVGPKSVFIANAKVDSYDPDGSGTRRGAQFLDSLPRTAPATVAVKTVVYDDEGHVPFGFVYDGLKWLDSRESPAAR